MSPKRSNQGEPRAESAKDTDFLQGGAELGALIRAKDWSRTAIGSPETWPQSLRTTVSLCLASNFPINIIWGPGHTQIYNDGYSRVCGDVHPRALGEDYTGRRCTSRTSGCSVPLLGAHGEIREWFGSISDVATMEHGT